jgi:integrase
MRGQLNRLARMMHPELDPDLPDPGQFVRWHEIDYARALALRATLLERPVSATTGRPISPSHAYSYLAALRGVLQQCWALDLIDGNTLQRLRAALELPAKPWISAGRAMRREIPQQEIAAAVGASDPESIRGMRDAALIATVASTGMREAGAASARVENYNIDTRNLIIILKGGEEGVVRVDEGAAPFLNRWRALLPYQEGPLFPVLYKGGTIGVRHMGPKRVGEILAEACALAAIPKIPSHDLRRKLATLLIRKNGIAVAQLALGHKNPATTMLYDTALITETLDKVDELGRSYSTLDDAE